MRTGQGIDVLPLTCANPVMPGRTLRRNRCSWDIRSTSEITVGRGPTSDISPLTTFHSCGNSSILYLRIQRSDGGTRGSSITLVHPPTAVGVIVCIFKIQNVSASRPTLSCLNIGHDLSTSALATSAGACKGRVAKRRPEPKSKSWRRFQRRVRLFGRALECIVMATSPCRAGHWLQVGHAPSFRLVGIGSTGPSARVSDPWPRSTYCFQVCRRWRFLTSRRLEFDFFNATRSLKGGRNIRSLHTLAALRRIESTH